MERRSNLTRFKQADNPSNERQKFIYFLGYLLFFLHESKQRDKKNQRFQVKTNNTAEVTPDTVRRAIRNYFLFIGEAVGLMLTDNGIYHSPL